jgi:allantoinase
MIRAPSGHADLVLTGGTLVTISGEWPRTAVAVKDGLIAAIGRPELMPPGGETLDLSGLHIIPGVVDAHVHFREPGMSSKEGFEAGSGAAALGGVTCVLDMPNTMPPTDTVERLSAKKDGIAGRSWVDYGCYGLLTGENLGELAGLHAAGVVGVKCFMGQSESGPGCPLPPGDGVLLEAMAVLARLGLRLAVHAENHDIMSHRIGQYRAAGAAGMWAHTSSRPPIAEVEAIQRAGLFAMHAGCKIHILHVSSAQATEAVVAQRAHGVDMTAETCPHYLLFAEPSQLSMRVNPPIRTSADSQALASALRDGYLDLVSSDHAPHQEAEKDAASIWDVRAGLTGVQHMLQLLLDRRASFGLSLTDIVRLTSYQPARVWGLWPRKGDVVLGGDADFTVVDLNRPWAVTREGIYSRSQWSPYLGWRGHGAPVATIIGGQIVAREGRLIGSPRGRWICRGRSGQVGESAIAVTEDP